MLPPSTPLLQAAYASIAQPVFGKADLENILEVSRRENQKHGITGVLLYQNGYILQIVEGPPEAVKTLLANIQRDRRHTEVHLLYEMEIREREFPDWTMGFHYAQFGFQDRPEGFNHMLTRFLDVQIHPDRRGTLLLVTFAGTTK